MKKIIFILFCLLYSNCATTTMVGDVITYTYNGDILKKYENVTIQTNDYGYVANSIFKTFGVNFYDKRNNKHIIIGNSVPFIIEYNEKTTEQNIVFNNQYDKEHYINHYKRLTIKESMFNSMLQKVSKDSIEYINIKHQYNEILLQKDNLRTIFYKLYGCDITKE